MSMKKLLLIITAFAALGILFFAISGGFVAKLDTENKVLPGEALAGRETVQVEAERLPVWQAYTGSIYCRPADDAIGTPDSAGDRCAGGCGGQG